MTDEQYQPYEPPEPVGSTRIPVGDTGITSPNSTRSANSTAVGIFIGIGVAIVCVIVGFGIASSASHRDPAQVERDDYTSCAAGHDEENSLFSDAEWCDLELNGGDGDGY